LEPLYLPRAGKEIEQQAVERQGRQISLLQFDHGDVRDEHGIGD
jgi:hypothetical protein